MVVYGDTIKTDTGESVKLDTGVNDKNYFYREKGNKYDQIFIKDDGSLNIDKLAECTAKWLEEYFNEEDPIYFLKEDDYSINYRFDLGGLWAMQLDPSSIINFELTPLKWEILYLKIYNYAMKNKLGW